MVKTSIIFGKDLSQQELQLINAARVREFNSSYVIAPTNTNKEGKNLFVLIKDEENTLVSFARLKIDIRLSFDKKFYTIIGISSVIALEKKKGYGKLLVKTIKDYILQQKKTAIGFCDPKNSPFYEKCGLYILKNGVERFIYLDENDKPVPGKPGDMLYIAGEDDFIQRMEQIPEEKVTSYCEQW